MRKLTIAGNVTKDAMVKAAGQDDVCSFSVAVNFTVKQEKQVMFFDCDLWGKRGAKVAQYITKGTPITVTGDLSKREYEGKTYLSIRVDDFTLQGGKRDNADTGSTRAPKQHRTQSSEPDFGYSKDNDIPF